MRTLICILALLLLSGGADFEHFALADTPGGQGGSDDFFDILKGNRKVIQEYYQDDWVKGAETSFSADHLQLDRCGAYVNCVVLSSWKDHATGFQGFQFRFRTLEDARLFVEALQDEPRSLTFRFNAYGIPMYLRSTVGVWADLTDKVRISEPGHATESLDEFVNRLRDESARAGDSKPLIPQQVGVLSRLYRLVTGALDPPDHPCGE